MFIRNLHVYLGKNKSWDPWSVPDGIPSEVPKIPLEIPIWILECPRWDHALILRRDPVNPTCAGGSPPFPSEIPDGIKGIPP